jgi:nucleoside-diphosphate-sugar epimerase
MLCANNLLPRFMAKQRILVTGATGFVGAAMVRHFAHEQNAVTALGRRKPPALLHQFADFQTVDVANSFTAPETDLVIHAAALASDDATDAALYAANVEGTRHVFEATRSCRTFVFISSSSVYTASDGLQEEAQTGALEALSPYGRSKRAAELWLMDQDWRDRTLLILRPRGIYGLGDRVLLPRLMRLVKGPFLVTPGTLQVQSSLTCVDNLCAAVAHGARHYFNKPGGVHVFNVADAEAYSMQQAVKSLLSGVFNRELIHIGLPVAPLTVLGDVCAAAGLKVPFSRLALQAVCRNNLLNTRKFTDETGFVPPVNFWDHLPAMQAWAHRVGVPRLKAADADLPWML